MLVIDLNALGILISDSQKSSALSFAAWIGIGLVIGFICSKMLNKTGRGLMRDVLLGVVGAMVGGFFSNLLGKFSGAVDLYSLVVAAVGAAVFMIVYHALFRRRRFLSMRFLRR